MGNNSSTYAPITHTGVVALSAEYTHVPDDLVQELYQIFTDNLTTETLSFAVLMNMLDRYYRGENAELRYSVIRKDGMGKMQSRVQKLIHDVMVELHMAQRAMERMQAALAQRGITFVSFHSCGGGIVALNEKDAWLQEKALEEARRTRLDWEGTHTLYETSEEIVLLGDTTVESMEELERCFTSAENAVNMNKISSEVHKVEAQV